MLMFDRIGSTLLFGIAANSDNLTVGIAYGAKRRRIRWEHNLLIAVVTTAITLVALAAGREIREALPAKLPDVLAYSESRNWIFLIEAVHSSGPISAERRLVLAQLLADCTALPVYVTAFLHKATYRKFSADIAWETEVWIASDIDHLIHFNGEKFLGPHQCSAL